MDQNFTKPGIALDIDDTLSDTLHHYIGRLLEKFGSPEKMTVDEIIAKYTFTARVPFWQTSEIKEWLEQSSISNKDQEALPVLDNAVEVVKKINNVVPVRMYITSRPSLVVEGTTRWLASKGFPDAEVITRSHSQQKIDGNAWKAEILKARFPSIIGIVDDNPEIINALGDDYQGTIYLFGPHADEYIKKYGQKNNVHSCPTWDDVLAAIKAHV
jgi:hypothetical protein